MKKAILFIIILLIPLSIAQTQDDVKTVITFSMIEYFENPDQATLNVLELKGLIQAYEVAAQEARPVLERNAQRIYEKMASRFSCDQEEEAICQDGTTVKRQGPRCTFRCPGAVCTDDVFECPDGTFVGRVAPQCKFAACPDAACGNNICEPGERSNCPQCNGDICPGAPCTPGSCPQDCVIQEACSPVYRPVCGVDDVTYRNDCVAEKAGVDIAHEGACETACLDVWDPVCGTDGETYSNACYASNAGVDIKHKGACSSQQACTKEYEPVCGTDGKTYSNECMAKAAGTQVAYEGKCESDAKYCLDIWDPVCGVDGKTYSNACYAKLEDVDVAFEGECDMEACMDIWQPVCGTDGETYSNACYARQAGIKVAHKGECFSECGDGICERGERTICYPPKGNDDDEMIQMCLQGSCQKDCENIICPDLYDPVCGVDGNSYSNECLAAGIPIEYEGTCEEAAQ